MNPLLYFIFFICISAAAAAGEEPITSSDFKSNPLVSLFCGMFFGPGGGGTINNPTNFPPLPPASGSSNLPNNNNNGLGRVSNTPGGSNDYGRGSNGNMNSFARDNGNNMNQGNWGRSNEPAFGNRGISSDGSNRNNNNYPNNGGYNNAVGNTNNNIQQVNNPMIERQFASVNDWYNDWYSRFQPVYMRLTQNINATPRGVAAANYANGVRMNFVENANSYLSKPGNGGNMFMKNLESRLNALGTNFPAEWSQVTCGTGFFFHPCGSLRE